MASSSTPTARRSTASCASSPPGRRRTTRRAYRTASTACCPRPSAAPPAAGWRWPAAAIDGVRAEGRLPIVVGGTGLYLKALTEGLAPVPAIPAEVRAEARGAVGGTRRRAAFAPSSPLVDPEAAARLPAADRQRLHARLGSGAGHRPAARRLAAQPGNGTDRGTVCHPGPAAAARSLLSRARRSLPADAGGGRARRGARRCWRCASIRRCRR